jgi:hypothetical protein
MWNIGSLRGAVAGVGLAVVALAAGGCVAVPVGPPVAVAPPVVIAPPAVVVPHARPAYGYYGGYYGRYRPYGYHRYGY